MAKVRTVETPRAHPVETARSRLADLQDTVNGSLTRQERERLLKDEVTHFFDSIFGQGTLSTFFSHVTGWIGEKMGLEKKALSDEEIFGAVDDAAEKARIESGVVSHRALGYGEEQNSREALSTALAAGETEIEFDVRLHAGELVLRHDPIATSDQSIVPDLIRFSEALELFHAYPNATMFVDVKGGASVIDAIKHEATKHAATHGTTLEAVLEKMVILGFNPEVIEAAERELPSNPLIFHYIPTGAYPTLEQTVLPALHDGQISKEHLTYILKAADAISFGKTNFAKNFAEATLHIESSAPFSFDDDASQRFFTYSLLPPPELLEKIKKSNGYISVPWSLVKEYPELFEAAHAAGVKVAVFEMTKQSELEEQQAIAMGANLLITDHPNLIGS